MATNFPKVCGKHELQSQQIPNRVNTRKAMSRPSESWLPLVPPSAIPLCNPLPQSVAWTFCISLCDNATKTCLKPHEGRNVGLGLQFQRIWAGCCGSRDIYQRTFSIMVDRQQGLVLLTRYNPPKTCTFSQSRTTIWGPSSQLGEHFILKPEHPIICFKLIEYNKANRILLPWLSGKHRTPFADLLALPPSNHLYPSPSICLLVVSMSIFFFLLGFLKHTEM